MSWPTPSFLKLTRRMLLRRDVVRRTLARNPAIFPGFRRTGEHFFAFKDAELAFARALSQTHSCLWVYRTNQRAFAGDFVVVDVSSPDKASRRVFGVELKRGMRLRVHDEGALQLRNVPRVIEDIARTGVIDSRASADCAFVTGDAGKVLAFFDLFRTARNPSLDSCVQ